MKRTERMGPRFTEKKKNIYIYIYGLEFPKCEHKHHAKMQDTCTHQENIYKENPPRDI